jgi:hypothetical protein
VEITASILGLAKNNNGMFKSEKQALFLISQMEQMDGLIGHASSAYHSCPMFASWDKTGITQIVKSSKTGNLVMFERKVAGKLGELEIKKIAKLKRELKAVEKDLAETIAAKHEYGDKIDLYLWSIERKTTLIKNFKDLISKIENA